MARKKMKDINVSGGAPRQLLKLAPNTKVYLRPVGNFVEEWSEIWPTADLPDGKWVRRFVADDSGKNIKSVIEAGKQLDHPDEYKNNWTPRYNNAVIVLVGTPQKVKVKGSTKKKTKIIWSKEAHIFPYGVKIKSKFMSWNQDEELVEAAEDKGIDMEEQSVLNCYYFTIEKISTGGDRRRVDYDLNLKTCLGPVDVETIDNFEETEKALTEWTSPTPAHEVETQIERNFGSMIEAEAEEEEEEEEEIIPKKKKKDKKKKPAPEPDEEEDEEEDDDEDEDEEEDDDDEEEDEDEIDPDDIEVDEEEEPAPKKKVKKAKKAK
jgi:hypothetical protein